MTPEEAYRAGYQAGKLSMPEIVLCRDCKHGEPFNECDVYCTKDIGTIESSVHKPDWFCADAKKVVNCND